MIVLNGGSSSGKSGIGRCLQAILPDPWLLLGVDILVDAMPASMQASDAGIEFAPAGKVFREWVAVPVPDRALWQSLLSEAVDFARQGLAQ